MLPNDDSIEIIDQNNNEGESSMKPDEVSKDDHDDSVEILEDYPLVMDEQNVREVKVLLSKNNVAVRKVTMDVPLLCNEYDIITEMFPSYQIFKVKLGLYTAVKDDELLRVEVKAFSNPQSTYQYKINIENIDFKPPLQTIEDINVQEKANSSLPMEHPPRCSSPKSVDSEETNFGIEMRMDSSEDEKFYSCIDDENDIVVKNNDNAIACSDDNNAMEIDPLTNNENCDALFAILEQDEDGQDKRPQEEYKEIESEAPNAKDSFQIETSRFYPSSAKKTGQRVSTLSQKTVQLSDSPILSAGKATKSSRAARDTILAVYPPPPARGGIPIYKENYKCLGDSEYLNDVIIDFYLKYLTNEVLNEEDRNRTHVFSSQFFTRLSKPPVDNDNTEVDIPEAERRHTGVERWTKNINIFEKNFVIIPINEHFHWNLAIICYPGLVDMIDDDSESLMRPCILFFDSLSNKSKDRIAAILRGYLSQEYFAKTGEKKNFSKSALKIIYPRVPKQSNATDCGLYVLQYVEQFFKNPIMDFTVPLDLSQWFKRSVITQKRAQIASLIAELAKTYSANKEVSMPVLKFLSDSILSDEEDLYSPSVKKRNPLCKDNYSNFTKDRRSSIDAASCSSAVSEKMKSHEGNLDAWISDGVQITKDRRTSIDAASCSSAVSKKMKSHQGSLDAWISEDVRDEPSTSDQLDWSSTLTSPELVNSKYFLDSEEDDVLMEEPIPVENEDKSLNIVSDIPSPTEMNFSFKSMNRTYSNRNRISVIKENFSGSKSHIFQKTSVYSDEVEEKSSSDARPKRNCRTKGKSDLMEKLTLKYREKKRKNELKMGRCEGEEHKSSISWIDTSVFNSNKCYSIYNADEDKGISPSTSYTKYKIQKKHSEALEKLYPSHHN